MGSWFCLVCEATGESVKFDLEARKHTDATGHGTVASHRDPAPLGQCIEEVRRQLASRRA
jgi:hypothetical protein